MFLDMGFTASKAQMQTQGKFRISARSQGARQRQAGSGRGKHTPSSVQLQNGRLVGKGESGAPSPGGDVEDP